MKILGVILAALVIGGAAAGWAITAPSPIAEAELPDPASGDADRGERVFWASGCASCHAAPKAEGDETLRLGGGHRFETPYGVFVAPNVSMDPEAGIGGWSFRDFANATLRGLSPDGAHYYPAFPYAAYVRMTDGDLADLWAFWQTLPAVAEPAADHELVFPFNIRRGVGVWKRVYLEPSFVVPLREEPATRGRYLVEALGHCGECHTPRDRAGGLKTDAWLTGAPVLGGEGKVPDITPSDAGIGGWSVDDIAYYLESGFTPEYDSVGGSMVSVVENLARLPAEDREAIAAYLKAIPRSSPQ